MKTAIQMRQYLDATLKSFKADPADTPYQRGYRAAIIEARKELDRPPADK